MKFFLLFTLFAVFAVTVLATQNCLSKQEAKQQVRDQKRVLKESGSEKRFVRCFVRKSKRFIRRQVRKGECIDPNEFAFVRSDALVDCDFQLSPCVFSPEAAVMFAQNFVSGLANLPSGEPSAEAQTCLIDAVKNTFTSFPKPRRTCVREFNLLVTFERISLPAGRFNIRH